MPLGTGLCFGGSDHSAGRSRSTRSADRGGEVGEKRGRESTKGTGQRQIRARGPRRRLVRRKPKRLPPSVNRPLKLSALGLDVGRRVGRRGRRADEAHASLHLASQAGSQRLHDPERWLDGCPGALDTSFVKRVEFVVEARIDGSSSLKLRRRKAADRAALAAAGEQRRGLRRTRSTSRGEGAGGRSSRRRCGSRACVEAL
jgi:hypothetical protein